MTWIIVWITHQVQDYFVGLLTCSPACYMCATAAHWLPKTMPCHKQTNKHLTKTRTPHNVFVISQFYFDVFIKHTFLVEKLPGTTTKTSLAAQNSLPGEEKSTLSQHVRLPQYPHKKHTGTRERSLPPHPILFSWIQCSSQSRTKVPFHSSLGAPFSTQSIPV